MRKNKPAKAKRPPLSAYVKAAMPGLRRVALIEREANLPPGSVMCDFLEGMETSLQTTAESWAEWIADGYLNPAGSRYTQDEEAALAVRIARILGPANKPASGPRAGFTIVRL